MAAVKCLSRVRSLIWAVTTSGAATAAALQVILRGEHHIPAFEIEVAWCKHVGLKWERLEVFRVGIVRRFEFELGVHIGGVLHLKRVLPP